MASMPSEGFIALHRKIREHPYWQDPDRLRAWIDLLFDAAWKGHTRKTGRGQVWIPRGSFLASERYLAQRWNWSRGKVRRFLEAAQEEGEIEPIDETRNGTIYRVVEYDTYQDREPTDSTTPGPAAAHQPQKTVPVPPKNSTTNEPRDGTSYPTENTRGYEDQRPTDSTTPEPTTPEKRYHHSEKRAENSTKDEQENKENKEKKELEATRARRDAATSTAEQIHSAAAELADTYCQSDHERRKLQAATQMILEDPLANWRNPHSGELVPEADRPTLYRKAVLHHFQSPGFSLPQSLKYTLKAELDPFNVPEDSEAATARQREAKAGGTPTRRDDPINRDVARAVSLQDVGDNGTEPTAEQQQQAMEWGHDHPDLAKELWNEARGQLGELVNHMDPQKAERMIRTRFTRLAIEEGALP